MHIQIVSEPASFLEQYGKIPIAFEATHRVVGPDLRVETLARPFVKDYDALPRNHPSQWPLLFDVSRWWIATARDGEIRVGSAIVIVETPGLTEQADVAVLWDIRVL